MSGSTVSVRLSAIGRAKYRDSDLNPHSAVGTFEGQKSNDPDWPYWVLWPTGEFNEYRENEIEETA